MFTKVLETLGPWSPLMFGLAFVAPVIAELLNRAGLTSVLGMPLIVFGLLVGAITGFVASKRGSWI